MSHTLCHRVHTARGEALWRASAQLGGPTDCRLTPFNAGTDQHARMRNTINSEGAASRDYRYLNALASSGTHCVSLLLHAGFKFIAQLVLVLVLVLVVVPTGPE